MLSEQLPTTITILRAKALARYLGIGVSTLYDWLKPTSKRYDKTFPKPLSLGARAKGWRVSDIEQWLKAKQPKPDTLLER
ncbi:hypothetical protein DKL61_01115 [Gammaproteobacteria bacterium ESL0073]|nr:hypothetical protein DKL61_01115 [Gammaproteobacteria bacterium ESL0073]